METPTGSMDSPMVLEFEHIEQDLEVAIWFVAKAWFFGGGAI